MKTRCPDCQTTFRVSPEQLKARAGKVRCGQCQAVFNALDSLIEENPASTAAVQPTETPHFKPAPPDAQTCPPEALPHAPIIAIPDLDLDLSDKREPAVAVAEQPEAAIDASENDAPAKPGDDGSRPVEAPAPLSESAAQELGKATGLILPRETTQIPGYSKWSEGVMTNPVSMQAEKTSRWPFVLVAIVLIVGLLGQITFRYRSELAVALPSMRPLLAHFSQLFNAELPLPQHVDLVSIETSDLQADTAHGNLLVLNATLRNRASYGQAYPALELSLTDTQDVAIARKVFMPADYLPETLAKSPAFAANSEVAVRLWIEAVDISAAGYRLYVFYP